MVLNPDAATFVHQGCIVTKDRVDHRTIVNVESSLNSSFVSFENWSIAGMNELVDSEAPRITPIRTQGTSICVSGFIESKMVKFLFDTGAEVTAIGREILAILPKSLRTAFQDQFSTLKMANGERSLLTGQCYVIFLY